MKAVLRFGASQPEKVYPLTTFTELGLDPALLKALEAEGYLTPTPIQAQAIPSVLAGRDLLGIAQTGTGKTAAFALPILHRLAADRKPAPRNGARVLVLSPTRELATQIAESFKTYGRHLGFSVGVIFGGVGYRPQAQALQRGLDILVATPGRLIDHIDERNADLKFTEILVLDEADQMMDLGFIRPLRQIISKLSARRQSMFFSATMPHEIGALAAELLRDPVKVAVTPVAKTADRVSQQVIFVEAARKRSLLVELFADPAMARTLVFTRTKRGADRVARHLEGAGIAVAAIHGNKSQVQRENALAAFKSSRIRALIATDIAARGIDIDSVSHVVNYEIPNVPESYVHRIGRTARAGAEGIAISLVDGEERAYLRDIERLTRQTIPSQDRRGDTSLSIPVETKGESANDDRPQRDRRHQGGHKAHARGRSKPHAQDARRNGNPDRRDQERSDRNGPGAGAFDRAGRPQDAHAGRPSRPHHEHRRSEGEGFGKPRNPDARRNGNPDRRDHERSDRNGPGAGAFDRSGRPQGAHAGRPARPHHEHRRSEADGYGKPNASEHRRHGNPDRRDHDRSGRNGPGAGGGDRAARPQGQHASRPGRPHHERGRAEGEGIGNVAFLASRGPSGAQRPEGRRPRNASQGAGRGPRNS